MTIEIIDLRKRFQEEKYEILKYGIVKYEMLKRSTMKTVQILNVA